eukprot:Rmarinus@m.18200
MARIFVLHAKRRSRVASGRSETTPKTRRMAMHRNSPRRRKPKTNPAPPCRRTPRKLSQQTRMKENWSAKMLLKQSVGQPMPPRPALSSSSHFGSSTSTMPDIFSSVSLGMS